MPDASPIDGAAAIDIMNAPADATFIDAEPPSDGHAAISQPCTPQRRMPVQLAANISRFLAQDTDSVYAFSQDTNALRLMRVLKDASGLQSLAFSSTAGPLAAEGAFVYWVDGTSILRVPRTGGAPSVIASELAHPIALAVDSANVYWSTATAIGQVAKDGGGTPITLVPMGSPAIVPSNEFLYYADGSGLARIPTIGGVSEHLANAGNVTQIALSTNFVFLLLGDVSVSRVSQHAWDAAPITLTVKAPNTQLTWISSHQDFLFVASEGPGATAGGGILQRWPEEQFPLGTGRWVAHSPTFAFVVDAAAVYYVTDLKHLDRQCRPE